MISQEKSYILTTLQKFPKNVRDLGKVIVSKGFKKSPNLVTLVLTIVEAQKYVLSGSH